MFRRKFLTTLGSAALSFLVPEARAASFQRDTLVFLSLRGGMDGLAAIPPSGDSTYYELRPELAIPTPGSGVGSAIDLDGFFGMHPAMAALKPVFDAGDLAIVHATGGRHLDRSHFNAQAMIERGTEAASTVYSGWLGRHLEITAGVNDSPLRGMAINRRVPVALNGNIGAVTVTDFDRFRVRTSQQELYAATVSGMFRDAKPLSHEAAATFNALGQFEVSDPGTYLVENNALYPDTDLGKAFMQAGQLIKSSIGAEVICLDYNGWDHHRELDERIPDMLGNLADSMAAFHTDLGTRMSNTTVVTLTEFGRRARENDSRGTDHGRASCMFAMGQGVNGGMVHADWPGLLNSQLNDGDLEITLDYRTVLGELLRKRMGNTDLAAAFPGFSYPGDTGIFHTLI